MQVPTLLKLAASPVRPLVTKPKFRNKLLRDQTWPQDVNWLRDTYNAVADLWENAKEPDRDGELFIDTSPKLRELVFSLEDVALQVRQMPSISRAVANARHDFEISNMYGKARDFVSALIYQSYSLVKVHSILETLVREASREPRERFSSFTDKKAYGYDVSGEVGEIDNGSQDIANRENQKNINDTAQPQDHHETGMNPANVLHDTDADSEFPDELARRNKRVNWPPRTR